METKEAKKKVHGQNLIFTSHTNKTETSLTVYAAKVALKNDTRESMTGMQQGSKIRGGQ